MKWHTGIHKVIKRATKRVVIPVLIKTSKRPHWSQQKERVLGVMNAVNGCERLIEL